MSLAAKQALSKVRLQAAAGPPMLLGAIVGDALRNLRSALDSIAWETCQRSGVSPSRDHTVCFPISTDPVNWPDLAERQLPSVANTHVEIFRQLQPCYRDELAREVGVEVAQSSAVWHLLARLHQMAKEDRHRVPHPILARAGNTWLGKTNGDEVTVVRMYPWPTQPGDVVMEWRVAPSSSVFDVQPDGEAILAFTERGAIYGRSALRELEAMHGDVTQALRRIEIEVLQTAGSGAAGSGPRRGSQKS